MQWVVVSFLSHTQTMWFNLIIHTHVHVEEMHSRQAAIRGLFISKLHYVSSINLHAGLLKNNLNSLLFTEAERQTSKRKETQKEMHNV